MDEIIEQELKNEGFKLENKGTYEVKNPYYNQIISSPKETNDVIFSFPIEIKKKTLKIIKLPFRIGRIFIEFGKDMIK